MPLKILTNHHMEEGIVLSLRNYLYHCTFLAYNFLHKNLPKLIPSLRTVQGMVHKDYSQIAEGEFGFDMLLEHIEFYKGPKVVAIGEDATRVVQRVQYDPMTNRIVGFVLPCTEQIHSWL